MLYNTISTSLKKGKDILEKLYVPYIFFSIITLLMLLFVKGFSKDTFMSHPQFGLDQKNLQELICLASTSNFYQLYFVADMFFWISILWIFYILFRHLSHPSNALFSRKAIRLTLLIVGLLGLFSDLFENFIYLGKFSSLCPEKFPINVQIFKESMMKLFLLVFFYYVVLKFKREYWDGFLKFLNSSLLSILILAIIGMGLTFMPQGATLIVHLFDVTTSIGIINLGISVLFVNILALILSHFPIYFDMAFNSRNKTVKWHLDYILWGMGIITYSKESQDELGKENKKPPSNTKTFVRHSLGIITYAVWFYVIYKAFDLYQLTYMDSFPATIIFTIGMIGIYFYLATKIKFIRLELQKEDNAKSKLEASWWSKVFAYSLYANLIVLIFWLTFIYLNKNGWSHISFYLFLAFILLNTITYMLFRLTRKLWVHRWGNDNTSNLIKAIDHNITPSKNLKITKSIPGHSLLFLCSNVNYVRFIRWLGISSLLFIVYANIALILGYVSQLNAINILLAFIINAYALVTISLKHYIFYKDSFAPNGSENVKAQKQIWRHKNKDELISSIPNSLFLKRATFIVLVLLVASYVMKKLDNIHKLKFAPQSNSMSVHEFSDQLHDHIQSNNLHYMAKVASFGGGLKSNLWTLLVMNKIFSTLQNECLPDTLNLLDRCISLSGVSGGAVGVGNYLSLDYLYRDSSDLIRESIINQIGNANIVSIDMTGIFVHDWLMDHISKWNHRDNIRKDRSYYAMQEYIKIIAPKIENQALLNKSQKNVWFDMFKKHGYVPALIINTASTGLKPGVAFSLDTLDHAIFPGYEILSDSGVDLRYYDAISTSNRFPVMSPAAQVENKGFFLDGGYFENSGLLTSSYFSQYLKRNSSALESINTLTINIINSKESYINRFIDYNKITIDTLDYRTNASAIMNGITNLEKLPNVLRQSEITYPSNDDTMSSVYLPHWITVADIENTLCGKFKITAKILCAIKCQNDKILCALGCQGIDYQKVGIVEPPLARTLSRPAVDYQKAMINHHSDCLDEIKIISSYLSK